MKANEVRATFLRFFQEKQHHIVPSAPIVVKNDPTLLFTNAGMNQFKDLFLGNENPTYARIADTQKCLRVSGKHNDLEEVGHDTYHHTMFEMLGNWSFGDYFKKEAISWAWELLTEVYKIPKEYLYVTIFEGDEKEGLELDTEAYELWKQFVPENRILKGNKKDNFWEMGDTGPCGPCTEIHVDIRPAAEKALIEGKDLVNNDHPQVIEIWNNVFMEFNRKADGTLEKLPNQHVDTGMGFERLCTVLQGKTSNYDTDVFQPLIQHIEAIVGIKYQFTSPHPTGKNSLAQQQDIAMRVIADHVRAVTFAIADGQMPSNNKAGYVIRRILRRAVRYLYSFLNVKTPTIYHLVKVLVNEMGDSFPEIVAQQDFIASTIQEEEITFLRTLGNGITRLESYFKNIKNNTVEGNTAFELFDTYGFPLDLTQLIARENGYEVDVNGFNAAMEQQKQRSRVASEISKDDWVIVHNIEGNTFVGYDMLQTPTTITRYRKIVEKTKTYYQLLLDVTPFYAESGGQIGDTGTLVSDTESLEITNTIKENNLILHLTDTLPTDITATFQASVHTQRRKDISKNHSATHLLHSALHQVIGKHATQKGSLVTDTYFRFDFVSITEIGEENKTQIEQIVNQKIADQIVLEEYRNTPIQEAIQMGAMALFGEKYGENVRVIVLDKNYSVELCGGTHVANTLEIGYFKILNESSIGAGIRRIEAITGNKVIEYYQAQNQLLQEIKEIVKAPIVQNLPKQIQKLVEDKKALEQQIDQLYTQKSKAIKQEIKAAIQDYNGVQAAFLKIDLESPEKIKNILLELQKEINNTYIVVASMYQNKPLLSVVIAETLVTEKNLHAGKIVKAIAQEIKGGGGGQATFATAGGTHAQGIEAALEKAKTFL